MKNFNLILLCLIASGISAQNSTLTGRICNLNSIHDTSFKVVFIKDHRRIDSTMSRTAGFYSSKSLPVGNYDIELSGKGTRPTLLRSIYLNKGANNINFSVRLQFNTVSFRAAAVTATDSVKTVAVDKASAAGSRSSSYFSAPSVVTSSALGKTEAKKSKAAPAGKYHEAEMSVPPTSGSGSGSGSGLDREGSDGSDLRREGFARGDLSVAEEVPSADAKQLKNIRAGQVTAGHWRDLDNWAAWEETNKDVAVSQHQFTWGFYPKNLMKVSFVDRDNKNLTYAKVTLLNTDNTIAWQTTTDQDGNAYFWPDIYKPGEKKSYKIRINKNGAEKVVDNISSFVNADTRLKVDLDNYNAHTLEVAFVVDATGSMSDEIRFLQVELMDVINRVQKKNKCLDIRTGSVFYRDNGDEYVTRVMPFSANPANTLSFISAQSANGGGDFPEAIDIALGDAVDKLEWSNTNSPKVMFILLDAPPHLDQACKERMQKYTSLAAEKGIRIVPIAASGINKSTEFLLKFMAMATNGEYVYITDDSKIGDTHLKPTGGESKVTYLNDLMVDIINDYSKGKWCRDEKPAEPVNPVDSSSIVNKVDSSQMGNQQNNSTEIIAGNDWYMKFYPNPAVQFLNIAFSEVAEKVTITDLTGKTLYEFNNSGRASVTVDISSWDAGIYMVYAVKSKETISGKLLVMH